MSAVLRDIIRYPIKGFSGQTKPEARLVNGAGLPFDRHLAFTNGQKVIAPDGGWTPCGAFVRLTKNADLPRFGIAFDPSHQTAIVTHPDGQEVRIARGDQASLEIANARIAEWFPKSLAALLSHGLLSHGLPSHGPHSHGRAPVLDIGIMTMRLCRSSISIVLRSSLHWQTPILIRVGFVAIC
jgi:hypothetical protein